MGMRAQEESDAGKEAAAAGALSALSDSLDRVGEATRHAGMAVRDRLHDSARAVSRGESVVRRTGMTGALAAATLRLRRSKAMAVGALGAVTAGLVALGVGIARRNRD